MKLSESNSLQWALARSPLAGPHPNSDVLTALAEGRLLQCERLGVLAHLASCADCREVLGVATGAAGNPVAELKPYLLPRPSHPPLGTWLTPVSIAAGILVVCSIGLLYQQKQSQQSQPAESKQAKASALPKKSITVNSGGEDHSEAEKQSNPGQQSSQIQSATSAEVTTQGAAAQQIGPARSSAGFVNGGPSNTTSSTSIVAAARPHWRIDTLGQPERSFGDGAWQPVLPSERAKMHVVSVFNGEVWIGGENTRLYHSSDNGTTWTLVALPNKGGSEHVIIHIRFQTSQVGTVEAADGTSWATADGGNTWN